MLNGRVTSLDTNVETWFEWAGNNGSNIIQWFGTNNTTPNSFTLTLITINIPFNGQTIATIKYNRKETRDKIASLTALAIEADEKAKTAKEELSQAEAKIAQACLLYTSPSPRD